MKVGSIVECVYAIPVPCRLVELGNVFPLKGKQYTVRELLHNGQYLRLEEIVNPMRDYLEGYIELCFETICFREIEFPPSLEEEIKESLTRELVYENS